MRAGRASLSGATADAAATGTTATTTAVAKSALRASVESADGRAVERSGLQARMSSRLFVISSDVLRIFAAMRV